MGIVPISEEVTDLNCAYAKRYEVDVSNRIVYEGFTLPGSQTKDKGVWAIRKYTYTGANTNPNTIYWADGEKTFTKTWSLRATYAY